MKVTGWDRHVKNPQGQRSLSVPHTLFLLFCSFYVAHAPTFSLNNMSRWSVESVTCSKWLCSPSLQCCIIFRPSLPCSISGVPPPLIFGWLFPFLPCPNVTITGIRSHSELLPCIGSCDRKPKSSASMILKTMFDFCRKLYRCSLFWPPHSIYQYDNLVYLLYMLENKTYKVTTDSFIPNHIHVLNYNVTTFMWGQTLSSPNSIISPECFYSRITCIWLVQKSALGKVRLI